VQDVQTPSRPGQEKDTMEFDDRDGWIAWEGGFVSSFEEKFPAAYFFFLGVLGFQRGWCGVATPGCRVADKLGASRPRARTLEKVDDRVNRASLAGASRRCAGVKRFWRCRMTGPVGDGEPPNGERGLRTSVAVYDYGVRAGGFPGLSPVVHVSGLLSWFCTVKW
jgi:hypothetical protein